MSSRPFRNRLAHEPVGVTEAETKYMLCALIFSPSLSAPTKFPPGEFSDDSSDHEVKTAGP